MGFKRHLTPRLINKNSATFDDSTEWILIRSVSLIPSWVAPQQSPGPFLLTCKDKKYNLTQFIVHSLRIILKTPKSNSSGFNVSLNITYYHTYCFIIF